MDNPEFIKGWKTLADGSRVSTAKEEAQKTWQYVAERHERQAKLYPTTVDALRAFIDVEQRIKDLGWRKGWLNLNDGDEFGLIELGSTGIFHATYLAPYFYYNSVVFARGRHYMKRITSLTSEEKEVMDKTTAAHKVYMEGINKSMDQMKAYMNGL